MWFLLTFIERILKPNEVEKKEVLIKTLSEILWEAGEKMFACVVQSSSSNCFETSGYGFNSKSNYYGDGITERVYLLKYECKSALKLFKFLIRLFSCTCMNSLNINH